MQAGEENTIIESIKFVGKDSTGFFADATISEEEAVWLANGSEQMPIYSAGAEESSWSAELRVGDNSHRLVINGILLKEAKGIALPDRLLGYEVTGIASFAFESKAMITGLVLPQYLNFIGEGSFKGCTGITEFAVKSGNTHFCAVDGVLYDYAVTRLVAYPLGKNATTFTLPNTLRQIPAGLFEGSKLEEVVFEDGESQMFLDEELTEEYTGSILDAEGDIFIKNEVVLPDNQDYSISYYDGGEEDGIVFSGDATGFPTVHTYGTDTELATGFYKEDTTVTEGVRFFVGWYDNYLCEGEAIEVLEAKSYTENIKLYAKWDKGLETNGDAENPVYYIDSVMDIVQIMAEVANASGVVCQGITILQTANIDFEPLFTLFEESSIPYMIGTETAPFAGTYDGQGYTIKNVAISSSAERVGLFGYTEGATIKNLVVENISLTSTATESAYLGGVVGLANGTTIENCVTNNVVISLATTNEAAGGVVGCAISATITGCVNYADVTGSVYVGGIVGHASDSTITECVNNADVTGSIFVGGIVGYAHGELSNIVSCINNASVSGSGGSYVGGIVGQWHYQSSTVTMYLEYCANYGDVTGSNYVGGIVGRSYSYAGSDYAITKYIRNCHNQGNVKATGTSTPYVGGIVGYVYSYYYSSGSTKGYHYIESCYSTGTVSAPNASTPYIGGVVGYASISSSGSSDQTTLTNCYWLTGTATASCGHSSSTTPIVTNCIEATEAELKAGTLTGLTDETVWFVDKVNYPTLLTEQYEEDGVIYSSVEKGAIIDITESFDASTFVVPLSVKFIKANAFDGATSVVFNQVGGSATLYEDLNFETAYSGEIQNATQDIYVKWGYNALDIIYKDAGGAELSGSMPEEYATLHTYGQATQLPIPTKSGHFFIGWCLDSACQTPAVKSLSAYGYEDNITLYAKWYEGLENDAETGKIAVNSAATLIKISELINSGQSITGIGSLASADYIQTADIDFNSVENALAPIGWYNSSSDNLPFAGTYDGNGYKISGLVINLPNDYVGLFGFADNATIQNVTIESGSVAGRFYVGGIVGYAPDSTIIDCVNNASVTSSNYYVGGIVGHASSTTNITGCVNNGDVDGVNYVGGIVGYWDVAYSSTTMNLEYCANYGDVTGKFYVGGIVGDWGHPSTTATMYLEYCANYGEITGSNYVGGIVGRSYSYAGSDYAITKYIRNCHNQGSVSATTTGTAYVGGIAGYVSSNYDSSSQNKGYHYIESCYSTGALSAPNASTSYIGGVVGYAYFYSSSGSSAQITITNCYWLEGTASAAYGTYTNLTPTVTNCVVATEAQLKGGALTGLTNTSIWYYDGGTSYPKLQFEMGNTMPELSATIETEGEDSAQNETLTIATLEGKVEANENNSALGSSLKVFGLSISGIFVMLTVFASKKRKSSKKVIIE